MSLHTTRRFDKELDQLRSDVLVMGGFVERAIRHSIKAVLNQDEVLAGKTIRRDRIINAMEIQCDTMSRNILARRQPAAGDLRFIVTAIKVVTDLEQVGDHAASIAHDVDAKNHPPRDSLGFESMGRNAQKQINRALDAFSREDTSLAISVLKEHEGINRLYESMYRKILDSMIKDQHFIADSIILSNIVSHLDSISCHARNIAQMVIYMVSGRDVRHVNHEAAAMILAEKKAESESPVLLSVSSG